MSNLNLKGIKISLKLYKNNSLMNFRIFVNYENFDKLLENEHMTKVFKKNIKNVHSYGKFMLYLL